MGYFLVVLSVVCFGAMALFAKIAYADGVDTGTLLALRFLIAAVITAGITVSRRASWPRGRELVLHALMGAMYALMAWSYFEALHFATSATVSLILYVAPVLVAGLAALLRFDRFGITELVALATSVSGLFMVLGGSLTGSASGFGLAFLAALFYAFYILAGSRVRAKADPLACACVILVICAIVFTATALAHGVHLPRSSGAWSAIGTLALLCTALAIVALNAGIRRLGPTLSSVIASVEPVVTVGLGIAFLDERPTLQTCVGGFLIVAAAVGLSIARLIEQNAAAGKGAASSVGTDPSPVKL